MRSPSVLPIPDRYGCAGHGVHPTKNRAFGSIQTAEWGLELGMVAETKRQSLPRLAQATKADAQAVHHFLAKADWSVKARRAVRLVPTRHALRERPFLRSTASTGVREEVEPTARPP